MPGSRSSKTKRSAPAANLAIFISHSSRDLEIVHELVELLKAALPIRSGEIRCTSLDGYRLPGGARVESRLREEVKSAAVLLGLVTPKSIESQYVMFELGARWGSERPLFPLVVFGEDMRLVRGPLASLNVLDISNQAQLHQLVSDLGGVLNVRVETPAAYMRQLSAVTAAISKARAQSAGASPAGDVVVSMAGYSVYNSNVILDQRTGFDWFLGDDVNVDWFTATDWVANLQVAGGGWRMPTIEQLATLFDRQHTAGIGYYRSGKHWPAHIHSAFQAIGNGSWVWSNQSISRATALAFNFNRGHSVKMPKSNQTYSVRVFAVRPHTGAMKPG